MNTKYLMIHQKLGIQYLIDNERCILGDEAGLGKTRQALEAAKHFVHHNVSVLVLCPNSLKLTWFEEAQKWGFPTTRLAVFNYEYDFIRKFEEINKRKWGVIIADEAHKLRRWESQRTKNFRLLLKRRNSRVWLLTGTPYERGAMDLHPLLSFVQPGKHGKYKDFCEKYCNKLKDDWNPLGFRWEGVKKGTAKELNAALNSAMLRRYKADEIADLPDKIISQIPIVLAGTQLDIFCSDKIIRAVDRAAKSGSGADLDSDVIETMQQLALKKIEPALKFCADALFPHPLVIFAHHRSVIYETAERLTDMGRKVGILIGGMSAEARQKILIDYQSGLLDDLVCSLSVAGVGLTLHRSSRCVFLEYLWTYTGNDQASDRLHRIGQKDCVNVYWLVAKGTFEERQLSVVTDRRDDSKKVVDHDRL